MDFSKANYSTRLDGLFVEDGVRGMLEGKDYKTVDMILPFIAAFIDRACGEVSNGPVTTVSVLYADLVGFLLRYNQSNPWRRDEIDIIEGMVDTFGTTFMNVFGTFHSTGMRTLKFHLLSHLAEDVENFGGLHNINAGVYEHAHCIGRRLSTAGRLPWVLSPLPLALEGSGSIDLSIFHIVDLPRYS